MPNLTWPNRFRAGPAAVAILFFLLTSWTPAAAIAVPTVSETGQIVDRMTARWSDFTDSHGRSWSGRSWLGTWGISERLKKKDIAGTELDELYQVNAFGIKSYKREVPKSGRYLVRLMMAEDYWGSAGKRVFDVKAENVTVLSDIDIYRAVGSATAYDRAFVVNVADGQLDLEFVQRADRPLLSAVEVTYVGTPDTAAISEAAAPVSTKRQFVSRTTAGWAATKDAQGQVWEARSMGFGTWNVSDGLRSTDIRGTNDDEIYRVNGWGVKWYRQAVPGPGLYNVRLLMAEDYFSKAGGRVFSVSAEGKVIASRVDIAKAVGKAAAFDLTFATTVTDGELTIEFGQLVNNPLLSAVEILSVGEIQVASTPASQTYTKRINFSPKSFFSADISKAPMAANSPSIAADLSQQVRNRWQGIAALNLRHYNVSMHAVPAGLKRINVGYHNCQNKVGIPWGLYSGPSHLVNVPVPENAIAANGHDGSMTIYDPTADQLWEFWQMRRTANGAGWEACWGGRLDNVSTQQGHFPQWFGTTATGIVMAGGMISIEDIRRGRIEHAMNLLVVNAQKAPAWSWPAQRSDGQVDDTNTVMEGQRLRLDPTLDLDKYRLTPFGRVVAKAAQRYGFVVTDKGGAVGLQVESGSYAKVVEGIDPWDALLGDTEHTALQNFPWDKLQALPKDYGKPALRI